MSKLITSVAVAASAIIPLVANAGTYYKLGSDASGYTSFPGTYSGGGNKIGWASSRDATTTVTPTDMANSDFVIVNGTSLRTSNKKGNYTFPGKTLVLETGGSMNVKAGESGGGDSSFAIPMIVGAGGKISLNAARCSHTFTGAMHINSGSSLTLGFVDSDARSGIFNSVLTGDGTTTLYLQAAAGNTAQTLELSDAAGFLGTIADGGEGAVNEKLILKLTGGFGGTITSLPAGTTKVLVNYDGLPSGKGLRIATTAIPTAITNTVTFYSTKNVFMDGDILMTFPAGTVVDPSTFTVRYAYGANETATAFPGLQKIDNQDGTVSLAVKSKTYYKLGTDAAGKNSFSGTYNGGGTSIGWTDSRTGTVAVTPTDMTNADFVVVNGKMLRTAPTKGNYTFPGKTLIFETGGSMTVKAGENGGAGDSTFAIPKIVGAGGKISLNAAKCSHTFTGTMHINSGSSFTLSFTGSDARSGIFNSTFTGDDTTILYLLAFSGSTAQTLEFSDAAGFLGTIADSGTGAANEKLVLKLTGGFGGTITSLPTGTQQVLVNYDGLPSGKGLRVASTTIPAPLKTTVTFYSSSAAFLSDGFVLMTFPSGTVVDPSAFTVKHAGSASETARTFAHLKKIDNADGTVSLAVFNDGDFPAAGDVIDLEGASRDIPSDWVRFCAGFTVTDTVGGGEARVEVASGVTVTNTRMTLAGKLKFVKEGAGTFVSALKQTYTGGNLIVGGVAMPPMGGGTSADYMPSRQTGGTYWTAFGNWEAGDDAATIRVNEGAVFDINGVYGYHVYRIILNGGTLRNSVDENYYKNSNGALREGVVIHSLEADSRFEVNGNTRYWDQSANDVKRCNLNNKTLTINVANGKYLSVSTSFTNGTIKLTGPSNNAGFFYTMVTSDVGGNVSPDVIDLGTVDLVHEAYGELYLDAALNVRNYVCNHGVARKNGGSTFSVYGTFVPNTQLFWPPVLMEDAAIDISAKNGPFPTASSTSSVPARFHAGATITVLTGDRVLTSGEKLISWAAGAEPDSTVKFVPQPSLADKWRFKVLDDGVYAKRKPGFMIIVR